MTMNKTLLATTLTALVLLGGCGSADPAVVDAPKARWAATKADCSTYHYTTVVESTFDRWRKRTTVQVVDDQPILRSFIAEASFGAPTLTVTANWVERDAEVGTHGDGAAAARTMEQLYEDCARHMAEQDPTMGRWEFAADEQGALQECLYTITGCDGGQCWVGETITDFACGPLDQLPQP